MFWADPDRGKAMFPVQNCIPGFTFSNKMIRCRRYVFKRTVFKKKGSIEQSNLSSFLLANNNKKPLLTSLTSLPQFCCPGWRSERRTVCEGKIRTFSCSEIQRNKIWVTLIKESKWYSTPISDPGYWNLWKCYRSLWSHHRSATGKFKSYLILLSNNSLCGPPSLPPCNVAFLRPEWHLDVVCSSISKSVFIHVGTVSSRCVGTRNMQ